MNFELKPLGLVGVASEKCDVLVVLVPQSFKAAKDDLSALVAQTIKSIGFGGQGRQVAAFVPPYPK